MYGDYTYIYIYTYIYVYTHTQWGPEVCHHCVLTPHDKKYTALWVGKGKDCFLSIVFNKVGTIHYCIKTDMSLKAVGEPVIVLFYG